MSERCRLIVPDGSLQEVVMKLLEDAGVPINFGSRSYSGKIGNSNLFPPPDDMARKMRPWDSPWVIADGKAELAFTGDDLVAEAGCDDRLIVLKRFPLSRSGVGKTKLVLAVPNNSAISSVADLTEQSEIVTEYPNFAARWLSGQGKKPRIRVCHGSLEAFIDIADAIIENTETGASLKIGGWRVVTEIMESMTCLITHKEAMSGRSKEVIDEFCLLLEAVMLARSKRLLKCNIPPKSLEVVLAVMPAANRPTISPLSDGGGWFAVEAVVEEDLVPSLIPKLKAAGATAIFDTDINRFVP